MRFFCTLLVTLFIATTQLALAQNQEVKTLYQVSALNALVLGVYDGVLSNTKLLEHGYIGLGTFDHLNGEMILLNGAVYRAKADGHVEHAENDSTPFAVVTQFEADSTFTLSNLEDLKSVTDALNEHVKVIANNSNIFYATRVTGTFSKVRVRSVPKQEKPYKPLAQVTQFQAEFLYEDLEGDLIGFWCPKYVNGLNMPGWHLHFLSHDKTKGGHILELSVTHANAALDMMNEYRVHLPTDGDFAHIGLDEDLSTTTLSIEGKKGQ